MQWTIYGAQIGIVDESDDYFSVPNSLTQEIVNVTLTSNVDQPGVWIFKVDTSIIAGIEHRIVSQCLISLVLMQVIPVPQTTSQYQMLVQPLFLCNGFILSMRVLTTSLLGVHLML